MANLTLAPAIFRTFFDDDGVLLDGGLLYTYAAGTSDKLAAYTDVGGLVPHSNPIILNSAGRIPGSLFLLPASYKFVLAPSGDTDPPTAPIATEDNVGATPPTNIDNDVAITAGEVLTTPEVIYGSDGSGALTAGRWYKASSANTYSSTLPTIGFVVADAASGATSTARISGRLTGFLGLTVGAAYYVGATPGTIVTTPPANSRYVGWADSVSSLIVTPNPPPNLAQIDARLKTICNGRLTLTTGVPVTTADVTAATTLYWAPYQGNQIALYSGSSWVAFAFAQLSIPVPANTNTMHDAFVDYNSGVPVLSLLAWTNDTTRATALTTQDGIPVLTGSTGKRYVGSFRTTAVSGQTEDSLAKRYVWNQYNRVVRSLRVLESANSWTYDSTTYQQANNAAANQLDVVVGVAEDALTVQVMAFVSNSGSTSVSVSIGQDAITPLTGVVGMRAAIGTAVPFPIGCALTIVPVAGRHYYTWIESGGGATTTWYGDNNTPTLFQAGIFGAWRS